MKLNTPKAAELIAFKGRVHDADEATLLGFERAAVEITFAVKMEVINEIERWIRSGAEVDVDAVRNLVSQIVDRCGADHLRQSHETRATLHGYLARRHGGDFPARDVWPAPGSTVEKALHRRANEPAYSSQRAQWFDRGMSR